MYNIRIEKTAARSRSGSRRSAEVWNYFTDHMFVCDYIEGQGWIDPRIVSYQPLALDPSCMVFHYGQEMFEGLKAYKSEDGRTLLFRPDKNWERAKNSNVRLCMPEIPKELFLQALNDLVKLDADWIPTKPGTSLYIRPFMFATDPFLGVRPSNTYKFLIILSPVALITRAALTRLKFGLRTNMSER